ncbi:MAG: hypothetical protein QXL15_04210 [Candidatus Korarchaeota archaeon]
MSTDSGDDKVTISYEIEDLTEETPLDLAMVEISFSHYYYPMIITMFLALAATIPVWILGLEFEAMPFSEESGGAGAAVLNVIFFIVPFLIMTMIMLILVKKRRNVLKILLVSALMVGSFSLATVYGSVVGYIGYLTFESELIYYVILFVFFVINVALVVLAAVGKYRNGALVVISAEFGAFLGFTFGTLTIILLLSVLAIYDFYSVFRGPLKKIIEEVFHPDSREYKELSSKTVRIGLGDLVFLSSFPAHVFRFYSIVSALAVVIVIALGMIITMRKVIRERKPMPGLPLSVLFGITTFVICFLIGV